MQKTSKLSLLCGSIPFIMLVFALPLVNRINPVILGLPFNIFWICFWILLTPGFLYIAYLLEKRTNIRNKGGDK